MICFVTAMEKEASYLIEAIEIIEEEKCGYGRIISASYKGVDFLILISGIGKVLSAAALTDAIMNYPDISCIINIGVGGSLQPDLIGVFDVVISRDCVQHDLDTSAIGDPVGFVSGICKIYFESNQDLNNDLAEVCRSLGLNYTISTVTTGDRFIVDKDEKRKLVETFDSASCDMESAAYATVADIYNIPFTSLRLISDAGGDGNEYENNLDECCLILSKIIREFIFRKK